MNNRGLSLLIGLVALVSIAAGGIIQSITGELGNLPLALIWIGLLGLLLLFYANFSRIRELLATRSTRFGANMVVMVAIFVVIIGMVSAMSVKYKVRVDLTANQRYSLSRQTVKLLRSLDREVEAIAFYRGDERTRQAMVDLLGEYAYHSPHFKFWFVDPDKRPAEAAKYGVTSYRTTLLRSRGKEEVVSFESEAKVTNALMKVLRDQVKTIYLTQGHGENSIADEQEYGYALAKKFLESESYQVRELLLVGETTIPADASVVVVSGPRTDLQPTELEKLDLFLKGGGSVLFMLDPAPLPFTLDYLERLDFKIGNDIVVDKLIRIMGTNYLTPVVMDYNKEHPLTREMANIYTFFPIARSVEITDDPGQGRYTLARTSSSSWARSKGQLTDDNVQFDQELDRRGPLGVMSVAAIKVAGGDGQAEGDGGAKDGETKDDAPKKTGPDGEAAAQGADRMSRWGKVVVVGDSNFASNTHIKLAGNRDLFLNTINWLAAEVALISVRGKEPGLSPLTLTSAQGRLVFWVAVIIMPSLFLVIGVGVMLRRKTDT